MLGDSVTQERTRAILVDAPVRPRDRLDADLLDMVAAAMRGSIPLETAVRPILAKLEEITGLESTYVTRIAWDEGTQRIAVARNAGALDIPEGAVVQWDESLCQHVVAGTVSTDDAPARFPASTAAVELGIRSYTGVPITTPTGTVYGTLCGASVDAVPQLPDTIALMELFARVIGEVVSGDSAASRGSVGSRGQAPRPAVERTAGGAAAEPVH
jgi:diguanylate cyclase